MSEEKLKATVAEFVYDLMRMADKAEERYKEEQQNGLQLPVASARSSFLALNSVSAMAKLRFKDILKTSNE